MFGLRACLCAQMRSLHLLSLPGHIFIARDEAEMEKREGLSFMNTSLSDSPTTMAAGTDSSRPYGPAKYLHLFTGNNARDAWLSTAVICLMTATMLALFWFPVRRAFANVEVNYNEGWNAYRAAMVSSRIPLYATPPQGFGTGTAYPPLSFHLIALLGNAGNFTLIGRLVSLISLLAAGVFVGLIVRRGGGSRQIAFFSFLLYEIGIALLRPDRIGMYDPQLLGEALSTAGLYFYFRNPSSNRFLCLSALLFCLAGFTKQNMIVFPAAVAIDLLFRSRRAFVSWAGAMVLSAGLLMGMTFLIDGRYFFNHLMSGGGRAYSLWAAWSSYHHYVEIFQSLLVIATAWAIYAFRSRKVFVSAFVLSYVLAFLLAGGSGVDLNIFFNALAATVIACGIALSDFSFVSTGSRSAILNSSAALMFAIFFISIMIFVPGQLRHNREQLRLLPARAREFSSAIELLKTRPGPALCESHLLCYKAGKPFEYEPFSVQQELKAGVLHEEDILQLLRTHHYQTVEVALRADEQDLSEGDLRMSLTSDQKEPGKQRRFSPKFMNELLADYQLSKRTSEMALFCPR
jgi:hypothetical protein